MPPVLAAPAQPADPHAHLVLFVSSVAGRVVPRHGAQRGPGGPEYVGCRRLPEGGHAWDEELVVAFTAADVAKFGGDYERELRSGGLRRRTKAEYAAQVDAAKAKAKDAASKPAPRPEAAGGAVGTVGAAGDAGAPAPAGGQASPG